MSNDKSIRRLSYLARTLAVVLGLMQLAYFLLSWFPPVSLHAGSVAMAFYPRGMEAGAVASLAPALRWTGAALALPALLALGYALLRLDRMLGACVQGRMFALATIGHMKAFTGAILATLVLTIFEPLLRAAAWRFAMGSSPQRFSIGVSSEEWMLVLMCVLFFVLASLMHEARRIAEDNEGFV